MGQAVKIFVMNPKSMPRSQLLGHMNNDTREFTEGVLTSSAREVNLKKINLFHKTSLKNFKPKILILLPGC